MISQLEVSESVTAEASGNGLGHFGTVGTPGPVNRPGPEEDRKGWNSPERLGYNLESAWVGWEGTREDQGGEPGPHSLGG